MLTRSDTRRFPRQAEREALRLIAGGVKFDLVLADFAMPGMTGAELAKAIHATRPELPVVIVTGYGGREVLRDFGKAILQKPYAERELLEKIARARDNRTPRKSSAAPERAEV